MLERESKRVKSERAKIYISRLNFDGQETIAKSSQAEILRKRNG